MINFLFFKIFLLIYGLIKLSKEIELIDKYSSINLNTEIKNDLRSNLINDYCNVAQSQIVNQLFNIILEEFNSSYIRNDKCFILDNIFNILNSTKYCNLIRIHSFIIHALYVKKISKQIHY